MKILNKKNILLIILSFVFALSTLVFASTATVRADDAVETPTGVFEVVEGASIRIGDKTKGEQGSGIRFMVRMSEDVKNEIVGSDAVKLGVIITTKEIFDARNAQYDQETGEEIPDYINSIGLYVNKTDDGDSNNDGIVINEDTIYDGTDADAGYFMANAAVTQIKEGNEKANYTAIAYIYNSESADKPYEYALIEDFSRSIVETASKVYINGEEDDETTSLESLRCVQGLENFGADASNPVLINDDNDLYALSDAVNVKEKAFTYEEIIEEETTQTKPVQFKLNKDVTVDWDFEQIGADFGGEFVESESKVEIVNNKNLENVFADATSAKFANECVNNSKVFTATKRSVGLLSSTATLEYVDEIPSDSEQGYVNDGSYTSGAIKMSSSSSGKQLYINLLNILKDYQEEVANKDMFRLKITAMLDSVATADGGYVSQANNTVTLMKQNISLTNKKVITTAIPLTFFYNAFVGEEGVAVEEYSKLFIAQFYVKSSQYNFYLGDIELVTWEETKEIVGDYNVYASEENLSRFTKNSSSAAELSYKNYNEIPTTVTYTETVDNGDGTTTDTEKTENIVNNTGYDKGAILYENFPQDKYAYVKLNYTADEYSVIAKKENFNAVKLIYMVKTDPSMPLKNNTSANMMGASGYGSKVKEVQKNKWVEAVLPITLFAGAYDEDNIFVAEIFRSFITQGSDLVFNIYFGDITFVQYDFSKIFIPTAYNYESAYGGFSTNTSEFVLNENLTGDNTFGYTGDAVLIANGKTNQRIYIETTYTADQYSEIIHQEGYSKVKIIINAVSAFKLMTDKGANILDLSGIVDKGKWREVELTIEQFISCFQKASGNDSEEDDVLYVRNSGYAPAGCSFYIGNLIFVK